MPAKRGQPVKLNPDTKARLLLALRAGNYRYAAAAYAGIHIDTFMTWMDRGRKALRSGTPDMFSELLTEVEQTEHQAEAEMVLIWRTHMKNDYRAIRDFLERRHSNTGKWSRREVIAHEAPVETPDGATVADPFCKRLAQNPEALAAYGDLLAALDREQTSTG